MVEDLTLERFRGKCFFSFFFPLFFLYLQRLSVSSALTNTSFLVRSSSSFFLSASTAASAHYLQKHSCVHNHVGADRIRPTKGVHCKKMTQELDSHPNDTVLTHANGFAKGTSVSAVNLAVCCSAIFEWMTGMYRKSYV